MSRNFYCSSDYVAIGPNLQIIAADQSYQRAKDLAIIKGVTAPWIIPASMLIQSSGKIGDNCMEMVPNSWMAL